MTHPNYATLSPNALRQIIERAWDGIAATYTHEQRFALAELERRADAVEASPDLLRADRDRWRADFQATEKTARELDEQWERLRLILGITDEIDDDFAWSELVDRVARMKADLLTLAKLASGTPEFFNPVDAWNAKSLRDRVLREAIREVAT